MRWLLICAALWLYPCVASVYASTHPNLKSLEDSEKHVIGGQDADIHDMPFLGVLAIDESEDNSLQFCGCTVIDPYWVLTAAHCLDDLTELAFFKLVFGTSDLTPTDQPTVVTAADHS